MAAQALAIMDLINAASACIGARYGVDWLPLFGGSACVRQHKRPARQRLAPDLRIGRAHVPVPAVEVRATARAENWLRCMSCLVKLPQPHRFFASSNQLSLSQRSR